MVCDDFDAENVGCNAVIERKGKAVQDELAQDRVGRRPDLRMLEQKIRCASNFGLEALAQTRDP